MRSGYGELHSLLQMKPLCVKGTLAWGAAERAKLGGHFDAIATELRTGLPAKIKAVIAAGDVKCAATMYDAALRGVDMKRWTMDLWMTSISAWRMPVVQDVRSRR